MYILASSIKEWLEIAEIAVVQLRIIIIQVT